MIRYLRQLDRYGCGPIAIMNLHKWQGLSATRKDLHRYRRLCRCTKKGTTLRNLSKALGKRSRKVTYSEFKKMVNRGSVIVQMQLPGRGGHFWFCYTTGTRVHDNKSGFLGVNYYTDVVITLITYRRMRFILPYCRVWSFE